MRNLVFALAALLSSPFAARAELNVVTSLPVLGSLAREVGGDRVKVTSLARGTQDPHYVDARPNLLLALNRADLLLYVGLDLEIGWLPILVTGARNGRIQQGQPGSLDCSTAIDPADVPKHKVDRSMGDVHPRGNPHYWLPPANAKRIAKAIAQRLTELDPSGKEAYAAGLQRFDERVAAKEKDWTARAEKLKGLRVATYHKSWTYVTQWLGLEEIGYVEPRPGIPPDPAHLASLVRRMKAEKAQLVLVESFYNRSVAQSVADQAGAHLLVLATDVGARSGLDTWFDVVDALVADLSKAR